MPIHLIYQETLMSQAMAATQSSLPTDASSVQVEVHPFNWDECPDPDAVLTGRLSAIGSSLRRGCHYLNPAYSVSSEEPSPAFFRRFQDAENQWINQCRSRPGDHPALAEYRKRYILAPGVFEGGFFSIDGRRQPRRVWMAMASGQASYPWWPKHPMTWRNPDLDALATSSDLEPLKATVRQEMRRLLATAPDPTFYVTPGFAASKADDAEDFLGHVRWCRKLWKSWCEQILTRDRCQELKAAADLPSLMMVFLGTLVIDGRIFVPGFSPDTKVTEKRLLDTPFRSPTVPPEYLGLESRS